MVTDEKAEADELRQHEDIQAALRQTPGEREPEPVLPEPADRLWLASYALVIAGLIVVYWLLDLHRLPIPSLYVDVAQRTLVGGVMAVTVFLAARLVDVYICRQALSRASRHNLQRALKLLVTLAVGLILLTVVFRTTWYTAAVSLGVVSLVLGLALQTPITSLIGWVYLLVRQPYRIGDRIKIGDAKGDVIDVGYLDTTLWEFGGPYLSTEHPSGRIIRFPNSLVLKETVYNYSWPLFPYVWNEVRFHIAYDSDLEFVARTMQQVVEADLGEHMQRRVRVYKQLLAQTPVDELQINERPVVHFRASDNTWLEAIVRYLVHPKESGRVKTRLIRALLAALNAEPDRVKFPRGNLR
jgi:small-conductance mechanosensitive channel